MTRIHDLDVLVLDVMMPGMDGISLARRLREFGNQTPIVMLTARDAMEDMVRGLDQGADDYITKPFSFQVLLARLRAISRRGLVRQPTLRIADLSLDPASREVYRGDRRVEMTPTEFKLLEALMSRSGQVVHRELLLQIVWGFSGEVESNTLDAFIRLLRQKIDTEGQKLIHTVRGVGYSIHEPGN
jgi:two-component system response regulator MprA